MLIQVVFYVFWLNDPCASALKSAGTSSSDFSWTISWVLRSKGKMEFLIIIVQVNSVFWNPNILDPIWWFQLHGNHSLIIKRIPWSKLSTIFPPPTSICFGGALIVSLFFLISNILLDFYEIYWDIILEAGICTWSMGVPRAFLLISISLVFSESSQEPLRSVIFRKGRSIFPCKVFGVFSVSLHSTSSWDSSLMKTKRGFEIL